MYWYLYVVSAVSLFSVMDILRKKLLTEEGRISYIDFSFLVFVSTALFLAIYSLLFGFVMPPIKLFPVVFVINIILGILGLLLANKALSLLSAGDFTILMTSRLIVTWLLSVLLLNIGVSFLQAIGILGICSAVFVIFGNRKSIKGNNRKGLLFGLGAAAVYGSTFLTDQIIYRQSDPSSYLLFSISIMAVVMAVTRPVVVKSFRILSNNRSLVLTLLIGFCFASGLTLLFKGLKLSDNATLVTGLLPLQTIIVVVLSIIFLNEKNNINKKILGALLATIGAVILVL